MANRCGAGPFLRSPLRNVTECSGGFMERRVTLENAPALGDIRRMSEGETVWLSPGVENRTDWGRYLDALASATTRGVNVRWLNG